MAAPPSTSLALVLGTATATTIACSLAAFLWGYAKGKRENVSNNHQLQQTASNGLPTELYLQRRHRGRLSFTSDDDDDQYNDNDEILSSAGRGDLCANNWHHFEGYLCNGKVNNDARENEQPPQPRRRCRTGNHPIRSSPRFLSRRKSSTLSDEEEELTQSLEGEDRRRQYESSDNDEDPRIFRNTSESTVNLSGPVAAESTAAVFPQRVTVPTARSHSPRKARTQYNARIMPHQLILVRHGQSRGNVDERLYATTPDNAMNLTELGWNQAKASGEHLKNTICKNWESEGIHFIVSPYVRTVETFHGILSAWVDPDEITGEDRLEKWYARLAKLGLEWHEDPRLREQDFGNFQDPQVIKQAKKDRHRFGAFYYRFPHGESASDVSNVRLRNNLLKLLVVDRYLIALQPSWTHSGDRSM